MKIDESEHIKQPWKVHSLLKDFKVEDVWLLPIDLEHRYNLNDVLAQLIETKKAIAETGLAGNLFKFRLFLGKLFKWDDRKNHLNEIATDKIRKRYATAQCLTLEDLPNGRFGNFVTVYDLENECLLELENNIVQATIHLGKIHSMNNKVDVHMTVYVKPKGVFGHLYMLAIKPFRLLIIYPTLMKVLNLQWGNFIRQEK